MDDKKYQIGDKWEVACSEFTCKDRKTAKGGKNIGATVETTKIGEF